MTSEPGQKMGRVFLILLLLAFVQYSRSTDSYFASSGDTEKCDSETESCQMGPQEEINVIITFTNAKSNHNLQRKFGITGKSILQHSSVPLAIYIIGDPESQKLAAKILEENSKGCRTTYRVSLPVAVLG